MPEEGSADHDAAHVDWLTIDTDAYCNVLEVEPPAAPRQRTVSANTVHQKQRPQRLPELVPPHPDTVHEIPAANVALEAASGIVATYELSVNGVVSVMIARSLYSVVDEYCG